MTFALINIALGLLNLVFAINGGSLRFLNVAVAGWCFGIAAVQLIQAFAQ